jgi:hypothetical protein
MLQISCCYCVCCCRIDLLQISMMGWDMEDADGDARLLAQPQLLLRAIQLLLVGELAAEPCLRQVVRNELYQ